MNIKQYKEKILKGCGQEVKALGDIFYCGQDIGINKKEIYLCPICQSKLKTSQETSKIRDEEELQFLQLIINEHRDLICCNEECWCWKIDNRIEEIKRKKEE